MLILTLILVAILALAAVELLVFLKPRLELSHQLLRRTVLGSAAATGIDYASAVLAEDLSNDSGIDSLEEAWAGEIAYQLDGISVTVKIDDEERKFPISYLIKAKTSADTGNVINPIGLAAFQELLAKLSIPPDWVKEAVDSLSDWIDADDQPRSFGAEDEYYGIFGYQARNDLPRTLGELRYVKGFRDRPEVTKVVFPFLSTFSEQVNLNTASAEVLKSVLLKPVFGSDESYKIDSLIQARQVQPFKSVKDGLTGLAQIDPKIYNQLTVTSSFFSVWSTAKDESGRRESVYAVLKRDEKKKKNRIIYWNQIPSYSQPLPGRE